METPLRRARRITSRSLVRLAPSMPAVSSRITRRKVVFWKPPSMAAYSASSTRGVLPYFTCEIARMQQLPGWR